MAHARAAILSIGDELTLGQTLNTNSQWLADRLLAQGIVTTEHATVPDDASATADALRRLASQADVVISTGGLGPTLDDLTRQGLAKALGEELIEDPAALAAVTRWFASRSRPMPEINRVQALRPVSATMLSNPNGTAPGLHARLVMGGIGPAPDVVRPRQTHPEGVAAKPCDIFCLPGPPREMRPMFEAQVVPRLQPATDRTVRTRVLHTIGLGESDLAARLGELMDRGRNPLVGTTASQAIVSCRIRYEAGGAGGGGRGGGTEGVADLAEAERALDETESIILARLGPYAFGAGAQTLAGAVLDELTSRAQTLAVVESCTGGLLGSMVTDVPGSSAAFIGAWVTYTNEMKRREVGVDASLFAPAAPGAVSRECAEAMARGGLSRSGATHCLSITGVAGPDGGTLEKPVGTVWIARASREGQNGSPSPAAMPMSVESRRFLFMGERANIREWSAKMALAMLRLHLIGASDAPLLRQLP